MKPSRSWLLTAAGKCFPGKIRLHQLHKSSYGKHGWKLTAVRHSKWCWSLDTSTLTCHSRMERKERTTCLNIQTTISLNSCSWSVFIRQWHEIKQTNKNITLKGGQNRDHNSSEILLLTYSLVQVIMCCPVASYVKVLSLSGMQHNGLLSTPSLSLFTFTHWRRKWQPTPVFLPGESQGRGSLVGCRLWGCTELDTTEAT